MRRLGGATAATLAALLSIPVVQSAGAGPDGAHAGDPPADRHPASSDPSVEGGGGAESRGGRAGHGGSEREGHAHGGEEAGGEPESVRLPQEVLDEFGIEIAVAGPGRIAREVSLPAEVRPNQDRVAHIAPRFPGIVKRVDASIGDAVRSGQVLAVVESDALAPFPLRTLIDGVILDKHITLGEPVSRDRVAFVIADLSDVWVDISVYQKDLAEVAVGQPVRISVGHGHFEASGVISYLSPTLDEETRTATARVVLPNREGRLRPGLFVVARIRTGDEEVDVAVPRTAVLEVEGREAVFVERDGAFVPQAVRTGRIGAGWVEILEGLGPGERYVARGGFTLKSELARESFAGGDGH